MEQIIKCYFGLYLILLFLSLQLGVISIGITHLDAQNFLQECVCVLRMEEDSGAMAAELVERADEYGYDLSIEEQSGGYAVVKLTYNMGIKYLELSVEKELRTAVQLKKGEQQEIAAMQP